MDTENAPQRTGDPVEARRLVDVHGAAILVGQGTSAEDAAATAKAVFANEALQVPPPHRVRIGGDGDQRPPDNDRAEALAVHTDGFQYGDLSPDYFLLCCVQDSPVGGESYLVDGHAVIAELSRTTADAAILQRLQQVDVDQTGPGQHSATCTVIGRTPAGRLMLRRFPHQHPSDASTDPAADQAMLDRWHAVTEAAADDAPRFKLAAGEVVIVDNYRMLHGRESYTDLNRLMWRVWVWTTSAMGLPDGRSPADSRYAASG